jgi:transcriptional regulator with XRE-family HTH domain
MLNEQVGTVQRVTVGERIREIRTRRKMTPAALARAAGVTRGAIAQIEDGSTKSPSFETGLRIATALGVSPYELCFGSRRGEVEVGDEVRELALELAQRLGALDRRPKLVAPAKRRPKG